MKRLFWLFLIAFVLGCGHHRGQLGAGSTLNNSDFDTPPPQRLHYTPTERRFLALGLVDIQTLDPSIQVHLVYATPDNFIGEVLYSDFHHAFFLPALAQKIVAAQREVEKQQNSRREAILPRKVAAVH